MTYLYKCPEGNCCENNKSVEVVKPMNDGAREEFCEECGTELNKIYGSVGIRASGDKPKF